MYDLLQHNHKNCFIAYKTFKYIQQAAADQ